MSCRALPVLCCIAVVTLVPLTHGLLSASAKFVRSDANNDGDANVSDAVFSLLVLFDAIEGFACGKAADVNDDGIVDLSDSIYALASLFQKGAALPAQPFPFCGFDPTDDELWCFESWCEPSEIDSWYPDSPFDGQLVEHLAFSLEYDEDHEQVRWVAYYLTSGHTDGPVERTDDYRADPLVETGSAGGDEYRGSGYDRGHLVPAGDMRWSSIAMSESFLMSNIAPQLPGFNRGVWLRLENQVRRWACDRGALHVVAGPVLEGEMERIGPSEVAVPPAFYKVILDAENHEAIAFIILNQSSGADLLSFALTVDEVEARTGLDFFADLESEEQAEFEGAVCAPCWTE